jgi:hypothetical protein
MSTIILLNYWHGGTWIGGGEVVLGEGEVGKSKIGNWKLERLESTDLRRILFLDSRKEVMF